MFHRGMILLAALVLLLDEPCSSDDSWPCYFIAPVTEGAPPDLAVFVGYSVSRQGYPYGVTVESEDPALVAAITAAVETWYFAPGHGRENLGFMMLRTDGVWRAPWEADCPAILREPAIRVEPEIGGARDLNRIFPAEATARFDILPTGEIRVTGVMSEYPFLTESVERAMGGWLYSADQACLGASAHFVFDWAEE
jgi:hypothetical protein